jgi:hypothetical protein
MDRRTRYGSYVPITTIGIAQFSDQRPAGDESVGSPAKCSRQRHCGALKADVDRHSPHDLVREHQDAPSALSSQGRACTVRHALRSNERIGANREGTRKSGSQRTRRWREMDSNPRSPVRESRGRRHGDAVIIRIGEGVRRRKFQRAKGSISNASCPGRCSCPILRH